MSCEPMATMVRPISDSPRSSSTRTCSPAWWPSTPEGTTSRPSARTREVSTPAPLGSGVATSRSRTRPRRTRTQSSMPMADGSFLARCAVAVGRSRGAAPSSSASAGAAKMSNVSAADTG